jgi:hypothetical protein
MRPLYSPKFSFLLKFTRRRWTNSGVLVLRVVLCLIVLILGLSKVRITVHAAVTISSFTAEAGNGEVTVRWETASEINSAGFSLYRSTDPSSEYQRIVEFIPSRGDQLVGWSYEYRDVNLTNGITYYYQLEEIDNNNQRTFYPEIASATPGPATGTPTNTPTITNTLDPSITPSITVTPSASPTTNLTQTVTRTPTRIPSSTPIPSATPTLEETYTPTPTSTPTNTPTLEPLPSLSLTYPSPTADKTQTPTLAPAQIENNPGQGDSSASGQSTILRVGLIASVALLWLLLGGWLYIFFYRGRF